MSVQEPSREQLDAAERLALKWASVRVDPLTLESGDLVVQVTSHQSPATRGGYTARPARKFDLLIGLDGETKSGILA